MNGIKEQIKGPNSRTVTNTETKNNTNDSEELFLSLNEPTKVREKKGREEERKARGKEELTKYFHGETGEEISSLSFFLFFKIRFYSKDKKGDKKKLGKEKKKKEGTIDDWPSWIAQKYAVGFKSSSVSTSNFYSAIHHNENTNEHSFSLKKKKTTAKNWHKGKRPFPRDEWSIWLDFALLYQERR